MFRAIALLVIMAFILTAAWVARPDQDFLAGQWLQDRIGAVLSDMAEEHTPARPLYLLLDTPDAPDLADRVRALTADDERIVWLGPDDAPYPAAHRLRVELDASAHSATVRYRIDDQDTEIRRVSWLSIIPPLLAVVAAVILQRVILCLALGIVAAGVIAVWPAGHFPPYALWHAFYHYFLHHAVLTAFRLEIVAFILLISATVGIAQRSGGISACIRIVVRYCRSARSARVGTYVAGLLMFFDDYLNCIVVGNAMRSLTDRYRVSREKLAYIVDSTAAPIAGISLVSTWIAFELQQIASGIEAANLDLNEFEVFVHTIPYRFYCLFTLVFVFCIAWTGRDYGAMRMAEMRVADDDGPPVAADPQGPVAHSPSPDAPRPGRTVYAIVPIALTFVFILAGLWWTGLTDREGRPIVADGTLDYLQQLLRNANSARAFFVASAIGFVVAAGWVLADRALTLREVGRASMISMRAISAAVVILFLAWTISAACQDVGTATYLVAIFQEALHPLAFSLIVFLLSCLVAFSTGSSFSTMAILLPNVVPLAFSVGENSDIGGVALVIMSTGAVLEGAIFGDHCSPISDTTILSSISCECDPIDHVRTQIPYAVTAMLIAVVAGYIPVALGLPAPAALVIGIVAVFAAVRLLGRRALAITGPRP